MVALIAVLLDEDAKRRAKCSPAIPLRPDHGHDRFTDAGRGADPGYPLIGRLRELAGVRGTIAGLLRRG